MKGLFTSWLKIRKNQQRAIIRRSSFFDEAWYLEKYADVASAGADAAVHYLEHGASEGRDPGPRFSTSARCTSGSTQAGASAGSAASYDARRSPASDHPAASISHEKN